MTQQAKNRAIALVLCDASRTGSTNLYNSLVEAQVQLEMLRQVLDADPTKREQISLKFQELLNIIP